METTPTSLTMTDSSSSGSNILHQCHMVSYDRLWKGTWWIKHGIYPRNSENGQGSRRSQVYKESKFPPDITRVLLPNVSTCVTGFQSSSPMKLDSVMRMAAITQKPTLFHVPYSTTISSSSSFFFFSLLPFHPHPPPPPTIMVSPIRIKRFNKSALARSKFGYKTSAKDTTSTTTGERNRISLRKSQIADPVKKKRKEPTTGIPPRLWGHLVPPMPLITSTIYRHYAKGR